MGHAYLHTLLRLLLCFLTIIFDHLEIKVCTAFYYKQSLSNMTSKIAAKAGEGTAVM